MGGYRYIDYKLGTDRAPDKKCYLLTVINDKTI